MTSPAAFATPRPPKNTTSSDNSNEANAYRVGDANIWPGSNSIVNSNNKFLYQDPSLPFNQAVSVLPYGGFYKRTDRQLSTIYLRNQFTYNQSFNDRLHQITALVGQEYISTDRQTASDVGVGYQCGTPAERPS
ncbi:hypothetical protein ACQ86N_31105 [Puia sp. P3]|uniref:hypothetical protein n=1 Tax=Puia sp. P3 TaxID=3423952 RepID=UPI003D67827F